MNVQTIAYHAEQYQVRFLCRKQLTRRRARAAARWLIRCFVRGERFGAVAPATCRYATFEDPRLRCDVLSVTMLAFREVYREAHRHQLERLPEELAAPVVYLPYLPIDV